METTLGGVLKRLRERAGLSQETVSAKAELSETYYGKIEGGKRRPDPVTLLRVLAVLEATRAEESAAMRLFMATRFPEAVLLKLQAALPARPQRGPAAASVVPLPKRVRGRRKLAVWAFAVASGAALGQPLGEGAPRLINNFVDMAPTRGILSRWARRRAA